MVVENLNLTLSGTQWYVQPCCVMRKSHEKKPYDSVDSEKVGDHDGTCNVSIGQLVWEKWSKMSTNQFFTVLVWNTVHVLGFMNCCFPFVLNFFCYKVLLNYPDVCCLGLKLHLSINMC